jgi:AcrR family transcriptional regulator
VTTSGIATTARTPEPFSSTRVADDSVTETGPVADEYVTEEREYAGSVTAATRSPTLQTPAKPSAIHEPTGRFGRRLRGSASATMPHTISYVRMNTAQRRSKGHRDHGVRDRLVDATRDCVRTRGVADTSSRLIAETAGVNLAAITYYFGSKNELVGFALAEELREWTQPALDRLAAPGDPASRLLGTVDILGTAFDEHRERVPGLLEVFVHTARDRDPRNPIVAVWTEVRSRLGTVIDELRTLAVIPAWVDPDAMASLIVAVVAGTVVNETVDPAGPGHRLVAAQFAGLLLHAHNGA